MTATIFANYWFQQVNDEHHIDSPFWDAAYTSLSRILWPASLGWLIFACVHGYGGPINWLLSLAGWQPLARISYAIYIVHLPVQIVLTGSIRTPGYFSDWSAVIILRLFILRPLSI